MSRSGGIGILESIEVAERTDDAVAGLGEVLKSFHDGGAELPPIGGVVIVGGGRTGIGRAPGASLPREVRGGSEARLYETIMFD
jgi:hypothetical protein